MIVEDTGEMTSSEIKGERIEEKTGIKKEMIVLRGEMREIAMTEEMREIVMRGRMKGRQEGEKTDMSVQMKEEEDMMTDIMKTDMKIVKQRGTKMKSMIDRDVIEKMSERATKRKATEIMHKKIQTEGIYLLRIEKTILIKKKKKDNMREVLTKVEEMEGWLSIITIHLT